MRFLSKKIYFWNLFYFEEDPGGRLIGRPGSERYFSELWVRPCLPLSPPSYSRIIIPPLISQAFWRSFDFLQEHVFEIYFLLSDLLFKCWHCHLLLHAHIRLLSHCKVFFALWWWSASSLLIMIWSQQQPKGSILWSCDFFSVMLSMWHYVTLSM